MASSKNKTNIVALPSSEKPFKPPKVIADLDTYIVTLYYLEDDVKNLDEDSYDLLKQARVRLTKFREELIESDLFARRLQKGRSS